MIGTRGMCGTSEQVAILCARTLEPRHWDISRASILPRLVDCESLPRKGSFCWEENPDPNLFKGKACTGRRPRVPASLDPSEPTPGYRHGCHSTGGLVDVKECNFQRCVECSFAVTDCTWH
eukprot:scaffold373_cov350-Pavlova_lutheri.AAC.12